MLPKRPRSASTPTKLQLGWLKRGTVDPAGRLPLFDGAGQRISRQTVERCVGAGWAEAWFDDPLPAGWLVCRLTEKGRMLLDQNGTAERD